MTTPLPTLAEAKAQAKQLRAEQATLGQQISHANALEQIAHAYGYRDWNSFHAAIANLAPQAWAIGAVVTGHYLGQAFTAKVQGIKMTQAGWYHVSLDLDQPVDVVTFDSFSSFRKHVRGTVGPLGLSLEKTSNGTPHLQIDL
jgi:hypothetical protein